MVRDTVKEDLFFHYTCCQVKLPNLLAWLGEKKRLSASARRSNSRPISYQRRMKCSLSVWVKTKNVIQTRIKAASLFPVTIFFTFTETNTLKIRQKHTFRNSSAARFGCNYEQTLPPHPPLLLLLRCHHIISVTKTVRVELCGGEEVEEQQCEWCEKDGEADGACEEEPFVPNEVEAQMGGVLQGADECWMVECSDSRMWGWLEVRRTGWGHVSNGCFSFLHDPSCCSHYPPPPSSSPSNPPPSISPQSTLCLTFLSCLLRSPPPPFAVFLHTPSPILGPHSPLPYPALTRLLHLASLLISLSSLLCSQLWLCSPEADVVWFFFSFPLLF